MGVREGFVYTPSDTYRARLVTITFELAPLNKFGYIGLTLYFHQIGLAIFVLCVVAGPGFEIGFTLLLTLVSF